jgi:inositol transport system permease protein
MAGFVASGFAFRRFGVYDQAIVKGMIGIAAVIADRYRERRRRRG